MGLHGFQRLCTLFFFCPLPLFTGGEWAVGGWRGRKAKPPPSLVALTDEVLSPETCTLLGGRPSPATTRRALDCCIVLHAPSQASVMPRIRLTSVPLSSEIVSDCGNVSTPACSVSSSHKTVVFTVMYHINAFEWVSIQRLVFHESYRITKVIINININIIQEKCGSDDTHVRRGSKAQYRCKSQFFRHKGNVHCSLEIFWHKNL